MNDSMGFIHLRYSYFQYATAVVGSYEHQEIVQANDPDSVPTCVERIVFRNSMSPRAGSEAQLREINIH